MQIVEALSAGQHVSEEDLLLLVQLRETTEGQEQLYSELRSFLLKMKGDPVVTLLTLQELKQLEASLEQRFKRAETEDNAEVAVICDCCMLHLRFSVLFTAN